MGGHANATGIAKESSLAYGGAKNFLSIKHAGGGDHNRQRDQVCHQRDERANHYRAGKKHQRILAILRDLFLLVEHASMIDHDGRLSKSPICGTQIYA